MLNLAEKHNHPALTINNVFRTDPTRTLMLRKRFVSDMNSRFRRLKGDIRRSIVDNDCFGLKAKFPGLKLMTPVETEYFKFAKDKDKLAGFMSWLKEMENTMVDGKPILEIIQRPGMHPGIEGAWTDTYIQTAYQKGILRARQELRNQGVNVPNVEHMPGGMSSVFNAPIHVDRVALLYARTFNELKGITEEMNQQISRVLAQGIAEGKNPRQIASWLNSRIELPRVTVKIPGVGIRRLTSLQRARTLARTEIIRAHHQATIAEYKQFGVEGVKVKAEFLSAGYGVCLECQKLEGKIFTLKEIDGMIPVHPNCLIDPQVKIHTSKGWIKIKDIKIGDLVLTHKGRFCKVTKDIRVPKQVSNVVRIELRGGSHRHLKLTLTEDHPVLTNNGWMLAKDLRHEHTIKYLANHCKECGVEIPYFKSVCSFRCNGKHNLKNPQTIKKMQNANNTPALKKKQSERWSKNNPSQLEEHRKQSSKRMKTNNPMFMPGIREKLPEIMREKYKLNPELGKKHSEFLKKYYSEHPEKHINAIMRKRGFISSLEKKMEKLLINADINYTPQCRILNYFVDFAIPELNIAIECDGDYWHSQRKEQDKKRQEKIEKEGWFVLRYTEQEIKEQTKEIENELFRIASNHNGDYQYTQLQIKKITKWQTKKPVTLYNLSVEEDESYVANGFVVHNCRCVAIPYLGGNGKTKANEEKPVVIIPKPEPQPIQLRIVGGSLYANDSGDGIYHHIGWIKNMPNKDGKT